MVAWSRNTCLGPAEIAPFVFSVLFKDREPSFNQGNEETCESKIFLSDPKDGKILLRSSASYCKIDNVL